MRIYLFNRERSIAWAERVRHRLNDRMSGLVRLPDKGRSVLGTSVRRYSITDIQYVIDYERVENGVRILRIRHAREIR